MSYDLMFQKAIELQNAGALNQAESIYLQMLQVMPENSDVWNLLGMIAQSKGNLTKAVDCFLSAIKYAPTPFFAHHFNLGLAYKALNKPKEALEALQKSVQLKADFKEGWNLLGIIEAENNHKNEAVKCFYKALEIDADYDEARANLCLYTNDLNSLVKLADDEPNNFAAAFNVAKISEDLDTKEKYLRRAIHIMPERTDALLMLAEVLQAHQNFNEALTIYHRVLNLDDNSLQAILGIADIYLAQDNLDKAEEYYLKSFHISRQVAGAHINYGTLLYQQKRLSEALEEYRKATELQPDKPEISYNLALILKETGDIEEALGLMFNAHLKAPENETFTINIAETLTQFYEKNPETALKIADNWLKKEPDNVFSKRITAALSGASETDCDIIYAERLFDNFAETYDPTIEKLQPAAIEYFKQKFAPIEGKILDLGCGTGLAAEALKNTKNTFDGVDVSENMIALAKQKGLYANLYKDDVLSFLKKHAKQVYDWVLAFDVFCYMGDLEPVLKALKGRKICFSVESGDEERGQNYYLAPNGRYKHKISYLQDLLKTLKFGNIKVEKLTLRKENGQDVKGFLIYAQ